MQYKNLGRSGLKVSQLSYGAWVTFGNQLDVKEAKSILQCCRDNGVNFFDNAEVYANGRAEEIMGQAIKELGWKRSDIVVSTKIFWGGPGPNDKGLSRKHIIEGTKNSLKRLDMDYVDVIYCHRPDIGTPIEETVRAMNHVIDKGWAYYWGTSEWSAQQITEAWGVAERLDLVGPIVEQPEYNLFSRHKVESEYLPLYTNYGIGLTTWSPLASGVLTGKYNSGNIPPDSRFALENYKNLASRSLVDDVLKKVNGLKPIADELGVPLSQLAIAWCASNVSSVITGATKEAQSLYLRTTIFLLCLFALNWYLTVEKDQPFDEYSFALTMACARGQEKNGKVMEKIEAVVQSKPKRPDSYRPQLAENIKPHPDFVQNCSGKGAKNPDFLLFSPRTGQECDGDSIHINPEIRTLVNLCITSQYRQNHHLVHEDLTSFLAIRRRDPEMCSEFLDFSPSKGYLDGQSRYYREFQPCGIGLGFPDSSFCQKMKFLCSFGGKILPRPSDGKLRYVGGETRIISIRKNLTYFELVKKTTAIWNHPHTIRYQLPGEDLDALISVSSNEDLHHMIEEYHDLERSSQRLRLFLVSSGDPEGSCAMEARTIQQTDVDYQYVVAVNGMVDPSPQRSSSRESLASHWGSNLDGNSTPQRDSPTSCHHLEKRNGGSSLSHKVVLSSPTAQAINVPQLPSKSYIPSIVPVKDLKISCMKGYEDVTCQDGYGYASPYVVDSQLMKAHMMPQPITEIIPLIPCCG
ncbi:UNVERIFIED_CONTAM: putative voltage-gated potassium channel subunit beta [Sesamum calycinum]|uniref:Probable voltage-gated potassium channel subunit beta n=1 Tax=Sesamum calycinum TaxID=2727403 RepID=A0AAW2RAX2_9LAMI